MLLGVKIFWTAWKYQSTSRLNTFFNKVSKSSKPLSFYISYFIWITLKFIEKEKKNKNHPATNHCKQCCCALKRLLYNVYTTHRYICIYMKINGPQFSWHLLRNQTECKPTTGWLLSQFFVSPIPNPIILLLYGEFAGWLRLLKLMTMMSVSTFGSVDNNKNEH